MRDCLIILGTEEIMNSYFLISWMEEYYYIQPNYIMGKERGIKTYGKRKNFKETGVIPEK
jgi:hypothetical protein